MFEQGGSTVSQTGFSPESPTSRITRKIGEAFRDEVRRSPDKWPAAARRVAIDCVKWLGNEVESENCRRDNKGVRFVHLTQKQSDFLTALRYEAIFDEVTLD